MRQLVLVTADEMIGLTLHDEGVWPAAAVAALLRSGGVRSVHQAKARALELDATLVEVVHRPARSSACGGRRYPSTTFCRVLYVAPSVDAAAAA